MITDDDVYDYMKHHGVKGMHWGVRKGSSSPSSNKPAQKLKRAPGAKGRAFVAVGKLVLAGAGVAATILGAKKQTKMNQIQIDQSMKKISANGENFLRSIDTNRPMPPLSQRPLGSGPRFKN